MQGSKVTEINKITTPDTIIAERPELSLSRFTTDNKVAFHAKIKESTAVIAGIQAIALNTVNNDHDADPIEALDNIINLSAVTIANLEALSILLNETSPL